MWSVLSTVYWLAACSLFSLNLSSTPHIAVSIWPRCDPPPLKSKNYLQADFWHQNGSILISACATQHKYFFYLILLFLLVKEPLSSSSVNLLYWGTTINLVTYIPFNIELVHYETWARSLRSTLNAHKMLRSMLKAWQHSLALILLFPSAWSWAFNSYVRETHVCFGAFASPRRFYDHFRGNSKIKSNLVLYQYSNLRAKIKTRDGPVRTLSAPLYK